MEAAMKTDNGITSVAAFVEGGVQEAYDDACSICLENFSQNDPSTVTNCRHEFHLQCILEWCQRSSNCPMCWQAISLKDPTCQELLDAVEEERKFKSNNSRNAGVIQHPPHRDLGLQHLSLAAAEAEFEERIYQHLAAAAAAMRRGSQRNGSSSEGHHPFLILTPTAASHNPAVGGRSESPAFSPQSPSVLMPESAMPVLCSPARPDQIPANGAGPFANRLGFLSESRSSASQSSPQRQDRAGQCDLQSLSESLRTRFTSWSTRYRESFSRNSRGLKERLFARSTSSVDFSEVQRQDSASSAGASGSSYSPRRHNMSN